MEKGVLDGPIPGENYTSDTRNYPWHRPADFDDLEEAMEWCIKQITEERKAQGVLALLESGLDIATLTDMFVTSGVGRGKWTTDFAILLAGPVANVIELMAKGYEIEYEMGTEQAPPITFEYIKAVTSDKNKARDAIKEVEQEIEVQDESSKPKKSGGFMSKSSKPSSDKQLEMLGQTETLEEI